MRRDRMVCNGLVLLALLFIPLIAYAQEDEADSRDPVVKREVLSEHQILVVYDSTTFRKCMGLTGSCPAECGGSGEIANFSVVKYLFYKKHDKYGHGKQQTFHFRVSDYYKKPVVLPEVLRSFSGVKKGDYLLISWRHDNVTHRSGSAEGDCIVLKFEKLDAAKAKELLEKE